MERHEIITIHGTDYTAMTRRLLEAADLARELSDRHMSIGIKPNLVVAKPASGGATTHPEIVAGVIEYLQEHGFENISVLEGSWVGDNTARAYEVSGIASVCRKHKVPFHDLQQDSSRLTDAAGIPIRVCGKALALDYLINLPVLKGHCQTAVTCALKNLKGLIPNSEKRRFHTMGLTRPIAHLSTVFPRQFIVVDNICGDLDFEEGGNPVEMNRIFCCKDPVLCDAFVCRAMGYSTSQVPYIPLAETLGAGRSDLSRAKITALNKDSAGPRPSPTRRISALAKYAADREACSACYGSLIYALNRLEEAGWLAGRRSKICIGQGYRGTGGAIGVGACTAGCGRSLGGCPPSGAEILRFLEENWD